MRLSFLGGADEIGASAMLVETAGRNLLVDCGLRQGARSRDPLPDLSMIERVGRLDAIIVTHAHFDHTGSLPLAHAAAPDAPVVMTAPSRQLVQILLRDALKIMGGRSDAEGEIPLYPEAAVDSLLARTRGVSFLEPEDVCEGVTVTFFPAGHILGAAAVGIESSQGRLLVSGDISVTDQLTVTGMLCPRFRADCMVVESTYGDRLHASRQAEERRLVEMVGQVVAGGGKVLFPAFAIGRAQEILLILKRAMAKKQLAPLPIHVDGMVRAVCEVYAGHPDWLSGALKRKIERVGNPFWGEDEWIRPVRKAEERAAVVAGPPCCIVASSGMLTGGPSAYYAAALAQDEKNLVAITGYQDEESPGRRLLDLAEERSRQMHLGGEPVSFACRVAKYSLSAHADGGEIAGLVAKVKPKDLILVHGSGDSRTALAGRLASEVRRDIHLPSLGESIRLVYGVPTRPARASAPIAPGKPPDATLLAELARSLESDPPGRTYALTDLAARALGPGVDRERREELRKLLLGLDSPLEPDAKRPFLFRRRTGPPPGSAAPALMKDGRLEQNAALSRVDALLGAESGLVKKGACRETWQLTLHFDFPEVAATRHAEALAQLRADTGWDVSIHPEANHARLMQVATQVAPPHRATARTPSVLRDQRTVIVWTHPEIPHDPPVLDPASREFASRTGWSLRFESDPQDRTEPVRELRDRSGRLEINQAYGVIRQRFEEQPHRPRRLSLKSDPTGSWIEAAFVSPRIGARYGELIEHLQREVGWSIRIFPRADQQAVLQIFRELVPRSWALRKNPGLDTAQALVKVQVVSLPSREEIDRVAGSLLEATGFGLVVGV